MYLTQIRLGGQLVCGSVPGDGFPFSFLPLGYTGDYVGQLFHPAPPVHDGIHISKYLATVCELHDTNCMLMIEQISVGYTRSLFNSKVQKLLLSFTKRLFLTKCNFEV